MTNVFKSVSATVVRMNKPYIIGIAGGSGAGKTFFLNCFLKHFSKTEVCIISQDDYYFPVGDGLTAEDNKLYNFDLPSTIDEQQFLQDLELLQQQKTVFKKEYTFNNPALTPRMLEIKPAPVIIVEGLFILHFKPISKLLNFKIFIEADEAIALQRRLKRDLTERGYAHDDVYYKWVNHVVPACNQFLLPYKKTCDEVIINNALVADELLAISASISQRVRAAVLV